MDSYAITLRRSPHISEAERRQRLYAAYSLLLSLSEETETADRCELADPDRPAANDAPPSQQRRARGQSTS